MHYVVGYEYKPHTDGGGGHPGKRVATTLVYCDAAARGGATVFPGHADKALKFVPREGDILFFEYKNGPKDTTHAACPVLEGNKTTFTMWHRLGVTPEKPWDNYETWGKFDHPKIHTRYKKPTFRERTDAFDL